MRKKVSYRHFDKALFLTPILIFLIGIFNLYSASFKSAQPFDESFAVRQILWMGIGVLTVFLIIRVNYFRLQDFAWPLYLVAMTLLAAVLFTPSRLGAHRWISIGGFNIQPSELAKLSVILVLARFSMSYRPDAVSKAMLLVPFLVVAAPFVLILKEPDLGTALTLIPILFAMLYLWGFRTKYLLALFAAGVAAAPFLFHFLKDYQKARLWVFLNPSMDPLGAGYTIIQSKIAIGSGGFLGKGYMAGTQNQLNFLPERHTDFIFAVLGEEGGFAVSMVLVALFWAVIRKGYVIAAQTPDKFGSQLACGISTMLAVQTLVNLGMTMGLLPVVGMPLPLVSYGGSSIIITMLAIGILLNIRMHRPLF